MISPEDSVAVMVERQPTLYVTVASFAADNGLDDDETDALLQELACAGFVAGGGGAAPAWEVRAV